MTLRHVLNSLVLATIVQFGSVAQAQSTASQASEASAVPVAISLALPIVLLAGAGSIVVTGVEASAEGTVWVVKTVADGVEGSIRFAGQAVGASAIAVGTVVVFTVVGTGLVLSEAGRVIAFIPNELGRSLSYNQRVSR